METINTFNQQASTPDMGQILKTAGLSMASELNCVRIGIVQEFYPEDLTVQVQIASKKPIGLNPDGSQRVREYAPIYAKVCYCNPFITYPIQKGDECVLLFSDREIESWFINGDVNPESYPRMHDLTDAVALFGIRSIPKMIEIMTDALHLYFGSSDIQLKEKEINVNTTTFNVNGKASIVGDIAITGDTTQVGKISASALVASNAYSGTIVPNGVYQVDNGIVTRRLQ